MSEALHSSRLYKKQCIGFFATAFIITLLQIFVNFFAFSLALFSDNYTDQPALAVIDNLLHRILQLHLTFFADLSNLGTDAVFYQLFDGFSENISLPHTIIGIFFIFFDECDQIVRLFLASYNTVLRSSRSVRPSI